MVLTSFSLFFLLDGLVSCSSILPGRFTASLYEGGGFFLFILLILLEKLCACISQGYRRGMVPHRFLSWVVGFLRKSTFLIWVVFQILEILWVVDGFRGSLRVFVGIYKNVQIFIQIPVIAECSNCPVRKIFLGHLFSWGTCVIV